MVKYNRAKNFIRATEMRPLSMDHKVTIVKCTKSMLEQIEISRKATPKNYQDRLTIIEKIYILLMAYPEILSSNPKLRNVAENKLIETVNDLPRLNLNNSEVLNDSRYFFQMIKARADYIEYNPSLHRITPLYSPPIHVKIPRHSYNLRPRKVKN
uniref:Uncharacterized protein n=1 Tax=viral metagenome TaxID=1070528 RepID=A0A6C0D812_9ZZZZ